MEDSVKFFSESGDLIRILDQFFDAVDDGRAAGDDRGDSYGGLKKRRKALFTDHKDQISRNYIIFHFHKTGLAGIYALHRGLFHSHLVNFLIIIRGRPKNMDPIDGLQKSFENVKFRDM